MAIRMFSVEVIKTIFELFQDDHITVYTLGIALTHTISSIRQKKTPTEKGS